MISAHIKRIALGLFVVVMVGCSGHPRDVGSEPGPGGVVEVVEVYATALAGGDGARACSLMSSVAQDALERRTSNESCPDAVSAIADALSPEGATSLRNIQVAEPRISGDTATVHVTFEGPGATEATRAIGSTRLIVTREFGRWGIGG